VTRYAQQSQHSLLDVLGESTISDNTGNGKVLAEELLASSAVVAVLAGLWSVSPDLSH